MSDHRDQLPDDTSEKKSDPDALRVQEAPLKQQGDALACEIRPRGAETAHSPERPKPS
jgi:hypothetical protein